MRTIRSLFAWLIGLSLLGGIASAIAAAVAKTRLVSRGGPNDDEFDLVTIYDGVEFASNATALRRASVLSWYGGATVDLREANLDPRGATIMVRAIFGGIELIVPQTWPVEIEVAGIFGGVADTRERATTESGGPRLTLTGMAVFGGVAVSSRAVAGEAGSEPVERAAEAGAGG